MEWVAIRHTIKALPKKTSTTVEETYPPKIQAFLAKYSVVFNDVHPHNSKDEIECAIKEMLALGHIHPDTSPFESPIVLIKERWDIKNVQWLPGPKQENHQEPVSYSTCWWATWSNILSKIDPLMRDHQIRKLEHSSKTAFYYRYRHFKFLVMPLGLTNAPAAFQ